MLRTPLRTLYTKNITTTANTTDSFVLPFSDFDSLVAKFTVSTLNTGQASTDNLVVFIQTTDDAGTTWYDCVAFGTITNGSTFGNAAAAWADIPVATGSLVNLNSATDAAFWNTGKGMPLLTNQIKVKWVYSSMAATSVANSTIQIFVNNQSAKN